MTGEPERGNASLKVSVFPRNALTCTRPVSQQDGPQLFGSVHQTAFWEIMGDWFLGIQGNNEGKINKKHAIIDQKNYRGNRKTRLFFNQIDW